MGITAEGTHLQVTVATCGDSIPAFNVDCAETRLYASSDARQIAPDAHIAGYTGAVPLVHQLFHCMVDDGGLHMPRSKA